VDRFLPLCGGAGAGSARTGRPAGRGRRALPPGAAYRGGVDTTVVDDPQQRRFQVLVDGEVAGYAAYRPGEQAYTFTHTEIVPAYEGKGLGSVLVRGALDEMRARGLGALPSCRFVQRFVERHPDYLELVPTGERDRFGLPAG